MPYPEFLYKVTQLFTEFTPLRYHDLVIPPEPAALPEGLLPAIMREAGLLMAEEGHPESDPYPRFYTVCRTPDSALGYGLAGVDLREGEKILQAVSKVLHQSRKSGEGDGVDLSGLIEGFLKEMAPRQAIEGWIEGALGQGMAHAFL